MNTTKSTGESSCKGQENGDASTGSERPLKKARFAWQIKGKYHLKNETDQHNKNLSMEPAEPSPSKPPSTSQSSIAIGSEVKDCHERDDGQFDTIVAPNRSIVMHNLSIARGQQRYPRYVSNYKRTSLSLVRTNLQSLKWKNIIEDQFIAQWQAKQILNGNLDNSLNRVLEMWSSDPLSTGEDNSRILALDFAEFINNLPEDNSVENEAILMAISAHGLQNGPSCSSNDASNIDFSTSSALAFDFSSALPSSSFVDSDDDSQQSTYSQCGTEEKSPIDIQDWHSDNQDANDATPFDYFSERSQSPCDFFDDNNPNSNTDSLENNGQFDVMNAAILYAIKSKGLAVSGTEYG